MHFSHLQKVPVSTLAVTFNQAFSDYVIPMHFTAATLLEKLTRDGINLEHSVGAFEGEKLVGFILQGLGEWEGVLTAYNGGTGVIPNYRGQKLTQQLYAYSIPFLKEEGVKQCLLEVVTRNQVALNNYQTLGFKIARTLESYKGDLPVLANKPLNLPTGVNIWDAEDLDWDLAQSFWDFKPSWGYNFAAIQRIRPLTRIFGIYQNKDLIGYAAVNENTNRVAQFAVVPAYRNQGIGKHLFRKLAAGKSLPLSIINVDEKSEATLNFLEDIGLTQFLTQYEMILPI